MCLLNVSTSRGRADVTRRLRGCVCVVRGGGRGGVFGMTRWDVVVCLAVPCDGGGGGMGGSVVGVV